LHLIDFEQLKIENLTLNEKIEERTEELHKLSKKTTQTVQVLTHVKEKLQFVQAEAQVLRGEMEAIEAQVASQRDSLAKTKQGRDKIRAENDKYVAHGCCTAARNFFVVRRGLTGFVVVVVFTLHRLRQQQGFVNNDKLVRDFERRKVCVVCSMWNVCVCLCVCVCSPIAPAANTCR
jgi:cell division septum initiation protein DivIVA